MQQKWNISRAPGAEVWDTSRGDSPPPHPPKQANQSPSLPAPPCEFMYGVRDFHVYMELMRSWRTPMLQDSWCARPQPAPRAPLCLPLRTYTRHGHSTM